MAREALRLIGPFAIVLVSAGLASGGTAATATAPTNGEIVERAAQKSVLGTSRVEFRFTFMDWRRVGFGGGGMRDYQGGRGFVTMNVDYQTTELMLPTLRSWLARPRLTKQQARAFRFDILFGGDRTRIRIREGNKRIRWRLVAPPAKRPFIFTSLAAANAGPVRVIRWLRSVSKDVVVPSYGRNVQLRGIDTTQYTFEIDPAKAARVLLPYFPLDQSREATLAQLQREIADRQILISASVWVDHDGRLRQIVQGYGFPEPGRPIQQARVDGITEFLSYGRPFSAPRPPSRLDKKVPPFPGFETSWPDLEGILSGAVHMR